MENPDPLEIDELIEPPKSPLGKTVGFATVVCEVTLRVHPNRHIPGSIVPSRRHSLSQNAHIDTTNDEGADLPQDALGVPK